MSAVIRMPEAPEIAVYAGSSPDGTRYYAYLVGTKHRTTCSYPSVARAKSEGLQDFNIFVSSGVTYSYASVGTPSGHRLA